MIMNNYTFPEVFRSTKDISRRVNTLLKAGKVRKLGMSIYTTNMKDPLEAVVSRNLWTLIGLLTPGAVVSFRTAIENKISADGTVFVTGKYPRVIKLPGLTIYQLEGAGPIDGDLPYMGSLHLASRERALLENLFPTRQKEMNSKTVGEEGVEKRLLEILRVRGEEGLNTIRDRAREISVPLNMEVQFKKLDLMIGTLLGSRESVLTTDIGVAFASGEGYDQNRIPIFDHLFSALRWHANAIRRDMTSKDDAFYNISFFDAYFSNYIEGTRFYIEEAMDIVFNGYSPPNRPADAYDILGTYRVASSKDDMTSVPRDFDDFVKILKDRHSRIMDGRPEINPGQFKMANNQAGSTMFVPWQLVIGTLRKGFQLYQALDTPFARALFMMFIISETHPFNDGNGRMARLMMNAELISSNETRIIIPSVYRNEYINSLKRLSNHNNSEAFIHVMSYAQEFVSRINFSDIQLARRILEQHNAFHDPAEDVKLLMPSL